MRHSRARSLVTTQTEQTNPRWLAGHTLLGSTFDFLLVRLPCRWKVRELGRFFFRALFRVCAFASLVSPLGLCEISPIRAKTRAPRGGRCKKTHREGIEKTNRFEMRVC